ncbi:MAG: sensor histidine kinase [Deltaproteobacteria bacterium HGW-Deltaproteobacteria-21]|nr:MAG: sensor histidine kinase [Deltaproteobacteria bacterium HGW-Deltaproteobacteria-21]
MIPSKWFIHPILIFIFSIVAVTTSLALYIYWYVEVSAGLKSVIQKANVEPGQALASQTWVVILVLSILVGLILMSIFIIFVYNQKTFQLYRLQRNFIDNFTHELKTPVTSLKLYLETFRKHTLSREDQIKYLDYMIQDAERLSDNINRILNLAKIESKAYKGEFVTRGLVSTLQEFSEKNRHLFKGCEIRIHNPSGEPYAHRVDLSLFEMLLMNLLTNAVKYNHSNAPRVDITFEQRGRELHIRFEDNGIGLPRSETKRIFRKFYQVPPLENTSAKGSGVGLFLVDSIARLHKGRIMAESKGSGKGSVFSVILPLNTPASIQEAEA